MSEFRQEVLPEQGPQGSPYERRANRRFVQLGVDILEAFDAEL